MEIKEDEGVLEIVVETIAEKKIMVVVEIVVEEEESMLEIPEEIVED